MGEKKIVKQPDKVKKASAALENARRVKAWIESQEEPRKPLNNSKNEEERKLANNFLQSRYRLLKPYLELKTEEEREKYRQKHPEIEEVIEIVEEIEQISRTNKSHRQAVYLKNVRRIKEWIEDQEKPRKPLRTSKNEEERKLAGTWDVSIKYNFIKPYLELKTEEEREKYRQKYPEIEEVIKIVKEIEIMTSTPLQNVRRIKEWIESQEKPRKPSQTSKNEKERKMGKIFANIKHFLIKPYLELKTEEEREKYRQKYPELDEVMQLVAEIEEKYGNKNQKRLAELLKTDLQKRKQVEEAKKLEAMYEQLENTRDSTISYEGEIMNE